MLRRRDYAGPHDLVAMQRAVQRDWTPDSHWHLGDLGWQRPSMPERTISLWTERHEVIAWAWVRAPAELEMHAPPAVVADVLAWFDEVAAGQEQTVVAMETDTAILDALRASGYREVAAPLYRHCTRDLTQLPPLAVPVNYSVRATKPEEVAERAAAHRAAWRLKWLGQLQVPPADLGDAESAMTTERYGEVMAAWGYRPDLDIVAEAADGTVAATALGWYDERNHSALLEPVGTVPEHARRGLGAAVSLACLHAMRAAGARIAKVCPRGDDAYPVPRRLYHRIGFTDAARTVTWRR